MGHANSAYYREWDGPNDDRPRHTGGYTKVNAREVILNNN